MKKILLFLFFTAISYGQADFPEGINLGGISTNNAATKVLTHSANGDISEVDKTSIGTTRSTGLIKNGILSINADPTKYNLSAGSAVFSDFSNPDSVTSNVVNFSAVTGKTPTYLNTSIITYVGINSSGAIEEKASPFTSIERRTIAPIGAVIHSNLLSINTINGIASPPNDVAGQMFDFMEAVGTLNTTGNVYSPSGANMMLNKSAGTLFKAGSNFYNDWRDPNKINQAAGTSITFRYRTQTGLEGVDRVTIDPDSYDVGGVVTAVPNNKWTIQTIYIFQSGLTRIQWGQELYNSLSEAKNAIPTRSYIEESNNKLQGVKRCFLIVMKGETALNTFVTDRFNEAQKFGGTSSGGVALTNESVTAALGYTAANDANVVHKTGNETIGGIKTFDNLILSNNTSTGSGVQSENFATGIGILSTNYSPGTGIQANNTSTGKGIYSNNASSGDGIVSNGDISSTGFVYVGRNSGANTFTVNKLGNVTANSFIKSGGTSSQFLKADGSVDSTIYQSSLTNPVTGTGTTGYIPKFTGTSTLGNSLVYDNGTNVGIGTETPYWKFVVSKGGAAGLEIDPDNGSPGMIGIYAYNRTAAEYLPITFGSSSYNFGGGNVGIGTTSTSYKLDVNGTGNFSGVLTAPTAPAGTNTTQVATTAFVTAAARPYKVYTALLSQTGTSAPTATVLENTLGGDVVWTRFSIGTYRATLSGAFVTNKTFITANFGGSLASLYRATASVNTSSNIQIETTNNSGTYGDNYMSNTATMIEIRVYN